MLTFLYILLTITSLLLGGVILIQDSKAGGLSSAFGGGGGDSLIGTTGAKQISKFTAVVAVVFFVLCIAVGLMKQDQAGTSVLEDDPASKATGANSVTPPSIADLLGNTQGTSPITTDNTDNTDTGNSTGTTPPDGDNKPRGNDGGDAKPPEGDTPPKENGG